jgi:hypothetical protein
LSVSNQDQDNGKTSIATSVLRKSQSETAVQYLDRAMADVRANILAKMRDDKDIMAFFRQYYALGQTKLLLTRKTYGTLPLLLPIVIRGPRVLSNMTVGATEEADMIFKASDDPDTGSGGSGGMCVDPSSGTGVPAEPADGGQPDAGGWEHTENVTERKTGWSWTLEPQIGPVKLGTWTIHDEQTVRDKYENRGAKGGNK